jgi:UDP:flavonoid glycosyltransferase YjiC (YdhE family)
MKILLVTRGSQGDIYPYLALATELMKRGQHLTLSLPRLFEEQAKACGIPYFPQAFDDITGMVEGAPGIKDLISWTRRVIDSQFEELIPLLKNYDILVSTNTEFAAPSIAEYCGKPLIRTAYAPLLPGRVIPPPVIPPLPRMIPAALQWKGINMGLNMMVRDTLNRNRRKRNMSLIQDQGEHAPAHGSNVLMYSQYLGETDPTWKYSWQISGYCFNDNFSYNEILYHKYREFVSKDSRPTLFFTLGSCNTQTRDIFCEWLFEICRAHHYKLVVGCGWWKVGSRLENQENLFLLDCAIPHFLIFPFCDAIIHHGGSGTTHSAGRAGKPQMAAPLLLDQFYWGRRIVELGIGPGGIKIGHIAKDALEKKVLDLMTNPSYKENAATLGEKIQNESGIQALCEYIESLC